MLVEPEGAMTRRRVRRDQMGAMVQRWDNLRGGTQFVIAGVVLVVALLDVIGWTARLAGDFRPGAILTTGLYLGVGPVLAAFVVAVRDMERA